MDGASLPLSIGVDATDARCVGLSTHELNRDFGCALQAEPIFSI